MMWIIADLAVLPPHRDPGDPSPGRHRSLVSGKQSYGALLTLPSSGLCKIAVGLVGIVASPRSTYKHPASDPR